MIHAGRIVQIPRADDRDEVRYAGSRLPVQVAELACTGVPAVWWCVCLVRGVWWRWIVVG